MAPNMSGLQLPNPMTPMAFFPPALAFQLTVSVYVLVGSLSIMVWDILNNLCGDYTLLTQHSFQPHTGVYFLARLSGLGYLLSQAISQTLPMGKCAQLSKITSSLVTLSMSTTSLLFFFRVRAIYRSKKWVVFFFFFLWLGVCGTSAASIFGSTGQNVGTTAYCIGGEIKPYVAFSGIAVVVFDSLVFFAISWNLLGKVTGESLTLRDIVIGCNLPFFTRAFLKDGQIYYLITVGFGIATTIILHTDAIPLVFRGMLGDPNLLLMNILACRVYRNTKLGVYTESPASIVNNVVNGIAPSLPLTSPSPNGPVITLPNSISRHYSLRQSYRASSSWIQSTQNENEEMPAGLSYGSAHV